MDDADLFKQARRALGMSVNDMAQALAMSNATNVRRWENGRLPVSSPALVAIRYMLRDAGQDKVEQLVADAIAERQRKFRELPPSEEGSGHES